MRSAQFGKERSTTRYRERESQREIGRTLSSGDPAVPYRRVLVCARACVYIYKCVIRMVKKLQGCHVHAIAQYTGALTAQGRNSIMEDTGFSFVNCKVTGSGALYLGRAWGPFSTVVFAYTYMDNIIIPKGWYNWGDPTREM